MGAMRTTIPTNVFLSRPFKERKIFLSKPYSSEKIHKQIVKAPSYEMKIRKTSGGGRFLVIITSGGGQYFSSNM